MEVQVPVDQLTEEQLAVLRRKYQQDAAVHTAKMITLFRQALIDGGYGEFEAEELTTKWMKRGMPTRE